MSEIKIVANGRTYSLSEAESLGILPPISHSNQFDENDEPEIEIIVDEETRSFRLSVNNQEPVDIPHEVMVEMFQLSSFSGIRKLIESDGVDEKTLLEIAERLSIELLK